MRNVVLGTVASRAEADLVVGRLAQIGITAQVMWRRRHPDHASGGAAVGAALGIALGIAAGYGVIALPGIRALVAAGPVLAAVSAAACIGLLFALVGSALGLLLPDAEDDDAALGNWLVAARIDRREERIARDILAASGGSAIAPRHVAHRPGVRAWIGD